MYGNMYGYMYIHRSMYADRCAYTNICIHKLMYVHIYMHIHTSQYHHEVAPARCIDGDMLSGSGINHCCGDSMLPCCLVCAHHKLSE